MRTADGGRRAAGDDFHADSVGLGEGGIEGIEGLFEGAENVGAEGFERGNIDGDAGIGELATLGARADLGENGEEGGEGFPTACGCDDEDVAAVKGATPSEPLSRRRELEIGKEPGGERRRDPIGPRGLL